MVKYIKDYYKILNISPNADFKTIEREYRECTTQYNKSNKTSKDEKKYEKVKEAHSVLSDQTKRTKYDKLRKRALENKHKSKSKSKAKEDKDYDKIIKSTKNISKEIGNISKILFNSGESQITSLFSTKNVLIGSLFTGFGLKKGIKMGKKVRR